MLNSIQVYVNCFYNKNKPLHYLFHNRNTGLCFIIGASQVVLVVKNPAANAGDIGDTGSSWEDPPEKGTATASSVLA